MVPPQFACTLEGRTSLGVPANEGKAAGIWQRQKREGKRQKQHTRMRFFAFYLLPFAFVPRSGGSSQGSGAVFAATHSSLHSPVVPGTLLRHCVG